jgi:GalNAc-alpha-(1->4)-GalNAc-alpha-(1->3)-diNAcBac-PP-undecaprenol alpha-1,4-N-acetyl-D-galactosaminyltransferase
MRITAVIGCLAGGGAERVCVNLVNDWVARGHQVTLLTIAQKSLVKTAYAVDARVDRRDIGWPRCATSEELNSQSIAPVIRGLHRAGCTELFEDLGPISMIRHAILVTAPDVVVAHIDMTNLRVMAAMQETGVPVIACEHTNPAQISFGRWQRARAILYCSAAAVITSHLASADWFQRDGARAFAIPNPLVPPASEIAPRNGAARHKAGGRRVVTLSRLSTEKRVSLMMQAFAAVAPKFVDWDLDIYGQGPLHAQLLRLIEELAPARIRLCGFTASPYEVLRDADLFVSTSWVEGYGNSIWEALACGVPVIAMECGPAVRSLVRDGVDGLIANTTGELVQALNALMDDEPRRRAFAARAPDVQTRFSYEASLEAWDDLLHFVT